MLRSSADAAACRHRPILTHTFGFSSIRSRESQYSTLRRLCRGWHASACSHSREGAPQQHLASRVAAGQHVHNILPARMISLSPTDMSQRAVSQMRRCQPLLSDHSRKAPRRKPFADRRFAMSARSILTVRPRLAWNLQYARCCGEIAAMDNMPRQRGYGLGPAAAHVVRRRRLDDGLCRFCESVRGLAACLKQDVALLVAEGSVSTYRS